MMCLTPGMGRVRAGAVAGVALMGLAVRLGGRSAADRARRLGGQRHHRASDARRRLDRGLGPGAHRLHRFGSVGVDDDGDEHLALADGEAGNGAGVGQRRSAVRAGNRGQRRHHLVARRHCVAPSPRRGGLKRPARALLDREFGGTRKGARIHGRPHLLSSQLVKPRATLS